ncbi:general stress protein 13 [Geomicrobium sp. JCM 19038]|nr:CvfD/Ygs/GSP13 family RNA-binding post-transcriptional regulator [Geomicrobium sp. JCM 19038]GAK08588.1 general stress protein 13 [Geomicrobium sp. JCM 19038]
MSVTQYEVGSIVEGKITGLKPFGAFVALDEKNQGLVHISEVAHGYVKDINEVLSVGEEVKVKVKSVDSDSGKISLSIRATQPALKGLSKEANVHVTITTVDRRISAATTTRIKVQHS